MPGTASIPFTLAHTAVLNGTQYVFTSTAARDAFIECIKWDNDNGKVSVEVFTVLLQSGEVRR